MRLSLSTALVAYAGIASAASAWNFDEAIISVAAKGDATNAFRDKYIPQHIAALVSNTDYIHRLSDHAPLAKSVVLTAKESLKIVLTATEDAQPKRPHQAMLLLRDQITGLEDSFTFTVKDSGKARVELVCPSFTIPPISFLFGLANISSKVTKRSSLPTPHFHRTIARNAFIGFVW